jgi:cyclic-di-AMP phosphodiesterase PgpH
MSSANRSSSAFVAERWREAMGSLSSEPSHDRRQAVLHHGARVVLLLVLAISVYLLFPAAPVQDFPALERGMVAEQDIIASESFPIYKGEAELAQEREEAAAGVAPIFEYEPAAVDSMIRGVRTFMAFADSAIAAGGTDLAVRNRLRELLASYSLPTTEDAIALLRSPQNRQTLRESLERTIREELPRGVVSPGDFATRAQQFRIVRDGREQIVDRDSVLTQQQFFARAAAPLTWTVPAGMTELQRLVLISQFQPSLRLNRVATEIARERARASVPVVRGEVVRGERIIAAREQVRDDHLEKLRAYQDFLTRRGELDPSASRVPHVAGALILNLLILSIFGVLLFFYRPHVYRDFRHVLLLGALVLSVAVPASFIGLHNAPFELIPIAFPALVVATLWDGRLALNLTLVIAILISSQAPFLNLTPRLLMFVGGASAALSVRLVRRRAEGLILGAVVAAAYAITIIALGMLRSRELAEVMNSVMWTSVNGIVSALIAVGFIPLFEVWTRITTNQTLLELADLNRPLLKRLSLEASGSYAHSINVANLAEAAARAIGANALLVRVGSYYHDIGKMATPQYFIENQARGRNPHDRLEPEMSAAIVRSHVVEGVRLAEQAKLPDSVRAFIPEHHGTQPIGFFLEQARQRNPGSQPDLDEFRYAGPKPQSSETAIVMMADSVESAAKAMQDPSPDRIRALVDRIVEGKIAQGQLDEAPLTLREISIIKDQFTTVLSGMYHHRLDYPPAAVGAPAPPAAGGVARGGA